MSAIAFHKNGTTRRKPEHTALLRDSIDISQVHIHPGKLLFEKFAGSGGTFIAGKTCYYPVIFIDRVNDQIFSTQRNYRINFILEMLERFLNTERLNHAVYI
jgi:hypothetical protein